MIRRGVPPRNSADLRARAAVISPTQSPRSATAIGEGRMSTGGGVEFGATQGSMQRLRNFGPQLAKFSADLARRIELEQIAISHDVKRNIERFVLRHTNSGVTLGSIKEVQYGMWSTISVGGGAEYLEVGAKEHPIYPVLRKALMFLWDGEIVFASGVPNHPGAPAYHFMEEAMDEANVDARLAYMYLYTASRSFRFQPRDIGTIEDDL